MQKRISPFFVMAAMLFVSDVSATVMDITMVPGQNNDLEVRVRMDQDFDEVFSSLVFTVRWSNSSGANLGNPQQDGVQQDVMNINTSGPEQVDGGYRYQPFVGFGFSVLNDIGLSFSAGQEFVLCHIPVLNANDVFSIVNDTWTAANNADFFVSLNGANSTGMIYGIFTGLECGPAFNGSMLVWPNPTDERITVRLDEDQGKGPVDLELFAPGGQIVLRARLRSAVGGGYQVLDLRGLDPAWYTLRARSASGIRSVQVVKQ